MTIPAAYAAVVSSLTIGSPANTLSQTVTLAAATSTLTTGGDVTVSAPNGSATRTLAVAAGTLSVGGGMYLGAGASGNPSSRVNRVTITTGTASVAGSLVFNAGNFPSVHPSQNQISISSTGTFNLAGTFTISSGGGTPAGTVSPGTTSTFNFNGSAAQTIPIGVSSITYANLTTNNTSASGATLSAAITGTRVNGNLTVATGTLDNGGNAITLANNRSLSVASGATLELGGTTGMVVVSGSGTKTFGATSTVDYGGADQTVANETYGNLSLGGSGVKTLPASGPTILGNLSVSGTATTTAAAALTVNGAFTLGAGATFNASTFSHTVKGAFSNSGTLDAGTSTFILDGTSAQAIGGASATTFNNLTLGNGAGVSLDGVDVTVGGTLALGSSILTTGASTVTASGAVTRTTGFVNGRLRKPVAPGASTPLFEVGTGSSYTPISLTLTGASAGGSLTASSTHGPASELRRLGDQRHEVRRPLLDAHRGRRPHGHELCRDVHVRPCRPRRQPEHGGARRTQVRRPEHVDGRHDAVVDRHHRQRHLRDLVRRLRRRRVTPARGGARLQPVVRAPRGGSSPETG